MADQRKRWSQSVDRIGYITNVGSMIELLHELKNSNL